MQRRGAVRKSDDVGIVLNISLMGSATTPHRVGICTMFFANRSEVVPDEKNITVPGILEKSWSANAVKAELATAGLQASCKNII